MIFPAPTKKYFRSAALGAFCCCIVAAAVPFASVRAQERTSISVTPPFVHLTMSPGDYWASAIKVINTNDRTLPIYATLATFAPSGEEGFGAFTSIDPDRKDPADLTGWIEVAREPVTLAPGTTGEIPFVIRIPEDASPGGHYAAFLIGTQSARSTDRQSGPVISVSSFVTTLFFIRIQGEVRESAAIREFSTDRDRYNEPNVRLALRIENDGNVHVEPHGMVQIFDVFGRKRAELPVNPESGYGNVLPGSVRRFELTWMPERSITLLGRYTAVATLTYGKEARRSATQTIVFWIVPVRGTAIAIGILFALLFAFRFAIRIMVRRALRAEAEQPSVGARPMAPSARTDTPVLPRDAERNSGTVDLRNDRRSGRMR